MFNISCYLTYNIQQQSKMQRDGSGGAKGMALPYQPLPSYRWSHHCRSFAVSVALPFLSHFRSCRTDSRITQPFELLLLC